MKNKGFVLTTDSFIGITLLALFMLISLSLTSQVKINAWNNIDLVVVTRDIGIVLEKNNVLENAVLQGSSEILLSSLNSTPKATCFEINLYKSNDLVVPKISAIKAGCTKNFDELIIINRSFVVNSNDVNFYIAKIGGWYNEN